MWGVSHYFANPNTQTLTPPQDSGDKVRAARCNIHSHLHVYSGLVTLLAQHELLLWPIHPSPCSVK